MDAVVPHPEIRSEADIRAVEAMGIHAFLEAETPYAGLERCVRLRPDACAIRYVPGTEERPERSISYAELLADVRRTANLFRRLGADKSNAVAIFMPNVPQAQTALWAAEVASRACPINPVLRPEHLSSILRASRARVAVVLGSNNELDVWDRVQRELRRSGIPVVLDADGDRSSPGSDGRLEDLSAAEAGDRLDFGERPDPDSVAALFPTGGTTGAPKLTLHTHRNEAFVAAGAALMYGLGPRDVVLNGFPLFHVAGAFVYGLSTLFAGATLLVPGRLGMRNRPFVSTIWHQVERYGITALGAVPTVLSTVNAIPVGTADISSLRVALTGGSPLPAELAEAFERRVNRPVRNILGMTECAGVVTIEPFHGPRVPGSTGLRLPFTEVSAFRNRSGQADLTEACAPGETGIIALRGPNVGPGYSDPALNAGTFERDGWLVSGDLGHIDASGRVFITGRAKDVIIRGAHNIDPVTIEDALLQHPAVAVAAAVGQIDAYAGELPVAFVTLKVGADADEEAIRSFVAPLVPEPAANPKRVWILPELPLTPVGKIYKPALKALAARHAIEERLGSLDPPTASEIAVADGATRAVVRVAGEPGSVRRVKEALLGLPIECEVTP